MRTSEILLVDDNPAHTDLTTEVLSRNRCPSRIHSVINGVEAVAFLRREEKYAHEILPDFVILDLNLPGMDDPCRARRSQRRPSAAEDSDRDLQYLRGASRTWSAVMNWERTAM
jgi:CheY-like chemotaxis protein